MTLFDDFDPPPRRTAPDATRRPDGTRAPAQRHSLTSRAAADSIEGATETLRLVVLTWLRSRGDEGGTDEEIQNATGMGANTERPRRRELEQQGLVLDSGRTRKTASGRKAVVWVVRKD